MRRGSITKDRDGWKFRFSYRVDGVRRHVQRRGFATKADADRAMTAALARADAGDNFRQGVGTVGDYLRDWLDRYVASNRRKSSTVYDVTIHVRKYLLPRLEAVPLRKFDAARIQRLLNELLRSGGRGGKPLSAKTVRNVHGTLRKAIQDGVDQRVLSWNPATAVDLPRWDRPDLDAYDADEIGRLLSYVREMGDPVAYALIRVLFATGMRRGEVLGLRWRDVDFVDRVVHVRETRTVVAGKVVIGKPKTRPSVRRHSLDVDSVVALAAAKSYVDDSLSHAGTSLSDDDFVSTQVDGRPFHPLALTRTFQRYAKAAGLRQIRLHDTRASAAQQQFALGIDPVTVSRRLGHSRVSTTLDVYGRFLPSHDQDAANAVGADLDRVIRQATGGFGRRLDAELDETDRSGRTARPHESNESAIRTTGRRQPAEATPGIEPTDDPWLNPLY